MESPTARERRFQCRRERERGHQAAETAAEKEERLRKHRKRDQERRAAETEEQRAAKATEWLEKQHHATCRCATACLTTVSNEYLHSNQKRLSYSAE